MVSAAGGKHKIIFPGDLRGGKKFFSRSEVSQARLCRDKAPQRSAFPIVRRPKDA